MGVPNLEKIILTLSLSTFICDTLLSEYLIKFTTSLLQLPSTATTTREAKKQELKVHWHTYKVLQELLNIFKFLTINC